MSVVILCGLLLVGEVAVRFTIDADYLAERINQRLVNLGRSQQHVTIGDVSASLLLRRLNVTRLTLHESDIDRSPVAVTADSLRISGINPFRSWWRRGLVSQGLTLWSPDVMIRDLPVRHYRADLAASTARLVAAENRDGDALETINRSLARSLPYIACDKIEVIGGALTVGHRRGEDTIRVSASNIRANFEEVLVDSSDIESRARLFFCRDFSFSADGPRRMVGDSLYELHIGRVTGSAADHLIELDSGSVTLSVSDDEFAERQEHHKYSFRVAVRGLRLNGIDLARLVRQECVMDHLAIDSLFFYVYNDKRLPPDTAAGPPLMPNEAFGRIPWYVSIDSLTVGAGNVVYAERSHDGSWPGTVQFTDTKATVRNLTNDPARMTVQTPAVAFLSGRIEGGAGMSVTMHLPLLSPDLAFSYRGIVKQLDPRLLNGMLVNLEGIQVKSGMADSIEFDVAVQRGRAIGELRAIYRDLSIDVVSKVDSGQGLYKKLKSALFNFGVLKSQNRPESGRSYEVGRIDYTRKPVEPFIKFIWVSLRGGLFDVIGLK